jgi:hypothetical protein
MDKELQKALRDVKENYTQFCESIRMTAELEKMKFDELQRAGFTKQEAFQIVKHRGVTNG